MLSDGLGEPKRHVLCDANSLWTSTDLRRGTPVSRRRAGRMGVVAARDPTKKRTANYIGVCQRIKLQFRT